MVGTAVPPPYRSLPSEPQILLFIGREDSSIVHSGAETERDFDGVPSNVILMRVQLPGESGPKEREGSES